jgi:hypothetical protein
MLNRFASLGSGRSKGGHYNELGDEDSAPGHKRLGGVEEVDEPVGYDLSGYEGTPMTKFEVTTTAAESMQQERNFDEAGFAAEYHRLEAKLGSGMDSIMEVPFTHNEPEQRGHRRGSSAAKPLGAATVQTAQQEAEKTGGIVAVDGKFCAMPCTGYV